MNYINLLFIIINSIGVFSVNVDDATLVTLPEGQIRGQVFQSPNGKLYRGFQEIPYAAPPIGELRFQPPVAPEKWDGVLNTTKNEKMCYQIGDSYESFGLVQTEDCLYLNVYTPVIPGFPQITLPVLVWIYGGSYINGVGAMQVYKPGFFIDYDIVVVTINYRLGPLGFLTTEDGVIPGNIGLKDQRFAIQWVKKNIHLFNGDPEKITISGESAGASSVGLQTLSEKNQGLFRGAILQSGTSLCEWTRQDYARFYAFELGRSLDSNFTSDDSTELLKLLQSLPASVITNNNVTPQIGKENGQIAGGGLLWLPVIEDADLEGALLTGPFHEDIKNGNINQVPILLGFNCEEFLYFFHGNTPFIEQLAQYFDYDLSNLIRNKFNMTMENKFTVGNKLRQIYTEGLFEDELGGIVKLYTDQSYIIPLTRHAKLQSNYTDVYLYQFSYKGKMGGLKDAEAAGVRGVGHVEDLTYMWGFEITPDDTPDDPEDLVTRHRLLTLWSNFVKYLNPTPNVDASLGNVTWDKVTPNNLVYLNINNTLEVLTNPRNYLNWERIIDEYAIPPLINY